MMGKPKIRFKGYNEDWEQRKLGEIATYRNGKAHEANQLDVGTYELVNLNSISIDGGLKPSGKFIEDGSDTLQRNDLVMVLSDVGHGDLLGRVAIIPENNRYVLNQRVALLRINDDTNTYFLFSIINRYQDYFKKLGAGSSQLNISRGIVENFEVAYPNVAEQRMIADYFQSLDHLITLHQHKCDEMKKLKKCMLQKMFPQNGKKVPEIRFEGFTNDWEQRKLGEVCQVTMGQSPNGSTYSEVPSDYILVQGNADLKDGWVEPRIWTTQKTKTAQAGDLIMSVRAPAGAMGKTAYDVVLGRGVAGIKGNEFVYQSLVKMDSDGYWKKMAAGSTFESINSDVVKNAEMPVPQDIEEQEKIGSYFIRLDHLITLHQHKCDELQNLKKYMLQNMFV